MPKLNGLRVLVVEDEARVALQTQGHVDGAGLSSGR
jgi:hypothetical protein